MWVRKINSMWKLVIESLISVSLDAIKVQLVEEERRV